MDIEPRLRKLLVLQDPGPPFTDAVMARVGDAPVGQAGVVWLDDARVRKRSRRILLITLVVIGVAAAMPALFLRGGAGTSAALQIPPATAPVPAPVDPALLPPQLRAQSGPGDDSSDPLDCIDPDVLRGLLLQPANQDFRIAQVPPPELAAFKAPRQLTWVGASERGVGSTKQTQASAVYRTSLAPDAARAATIAALTAGGWTLQADNRFFSSKVFAPPHVQFSDTYCREGMPVNITADTLDGVTYVAITASRVNRGAGVSTLCDQPQSAARPLSAFDQLLPVLELPRDPVTGRPVLSLGGGGGGSSDARSRLNVSFALQDSAENVARHFAVQMAAQGWSADANWSGTGTAGSTWTRRLDADSVLQGTLMVSAVAPGRFTVVFHATRTK